MPRKPSINKILVIIFIFIVNECECVIKFAELSEASKKTLIHQGGPMTSEEANIFRENPQFQAILRLRSWDELAKDPDCETLNLDFYEKLCYDYLNKTLKD